MKTINSLFLSLAALFILSACEDDADKYYLSSLTENELIASTNNIVLTEDIAQRMFCHWHGPTGHWLSAIRISNRPTY